MKNTVHRNISFVCSIDNGLSICDLNRVTKDEALTYETYQLAGRVTHYECTTDEDDSGMKFWKLEANHKSIIFSFTCASNPDPCLLSSSALEKAKTLRLR